MSPGLRSLIVAGALLTLLPSLSACTSGSAPQSDAGATAVTTPTDGQQLAGDGPGISVEHALSSGLAGPLLVNGFVVAHGDSVLLCDALSENSPPQCSGASMPVRGFDLATLPGAKHAADVTWSDTSVQLLGEVQNHVLVISPTSQG
jgi:hypothetical protein